MSALARALPILAAVNVLAAPVQNVNHDISPPFGEEAASWADGAVTEYQIHSSCNHTQSNQIAAGLDEAVQLARHAKEHVLRWGNSSEHYQKYFGHEPRGEVIGNLDKIVSADRAGILFRCDNPDGNCALEDWAGHWRGENASSETVICDLSYEARWPLSKMCALGYNVAEWPTNIFWASDLMHRLYHVPAIGEGHVEHYTDTHEEVLEMATQNSSYSTHDSDTLQYFALEVFAYDIAVPGTGCPGPGTGESASTMTSSADSTLSTETESAEHSSESASGTVEPPSMSTESGEHMSESGEQTGESGEHMSESGEHMSESDEQTSESGEQTGESGEQTGESGEQTGESGEQTGESDEQTGESDEQTGESDEQMSESATETAESDTIAVEAPADSPTLTDEASSETSELPENCHYHGDELHCT